ncbi:MAG TPA: hypothetical protein VFY12_00380 [Arenimonas sp.]|nr:hypothetical protein [Arenimonas sp.]
MIDAFRQPLTALCAGFALWTLGLLVLALLGLGARFAPLADDPSLAPALPELRLAEASARLGALTDYPEIGQRPLLSPDRRPTAGGELPSDNGAPLDAMLTGVIISGDVRIALLQDAEGSRSRRVREGELLEGTAWRLQSLQPRRAVFIGPEGEKALELRVFDGKGGAAPTPLATTSDAGASGDAPAQAEPAQATAAAQAAKPSDAAAEQQAQVEEIRRRIEARRAQMRAEAARKAATQEDKK